MTLGSYFFLSGPQPTSPFLTRAVAPAPVSLAQYTETQVRHGPPLLKKDQEEGRDEDKAEARTEDEGGNEGVPQGGCCCQVAHTLIQRLQPRENQSWNC